MSSTGKLGPSSLEQVTQIVAALCRFDVVPAVVAKVLIDETRIDQLVQRHHRVERLLRHHGLHVGDIDLGIEPAIRIDGQRVPLWTEIEIVQLVVLLVGVPGRVDLTRNLDVGLLASGCACVREPR